MKKVTYKDIADFIHKSEQQIKWYKKNNITIEMIKTCIELKEMAKEKEGSEDD